jgi:hypothetical protein
MSGTGQMVVKIPMRLEYLLTECILLALSFGPPGALPDPQLSQSDLKERGRSVCPNFAVPLWMWRSNMWPARPIRAGTF